MDLHLDLFYPAALTAGSVIAGFIGTFFSFRIQREANYYRQPVLDFETGSSKNVNIDDTHFTVSLFLLCLGAIFALIFGIVSPLLELAGFELLPILGSPRAVIVGLLASLVFVVGSFLAELIHYRIIKSCDGEGWKNEGWLIGVTIGAAAVIWVCVYRF